jgi:glycine/sarcosine/betaine reductase complex component A
MDLDTQANILRVATEVGRENLVVILGSPNPESAGLYAETVTIGDPAYAGPLAGVSLGLPVFHILESEVRGQIAPDVYEREIGMMAIALDGDAIATQIRAVRNKTGA